MSNPADLPPIRPDGTRFDVVGIGNALVDVLSNEDESFIERMSLAKGAMALIETERADVLYDAMGAGTEVSGGSAANTMAGIASFDGAAAYLGRVCDDQLGAVFAHDMRSVGVTYRSDLAASGAPTGRCLIIVTPDAERTLNTYLGASADFGPDDLDAELIEAGHITFLEGYLFDRAPAKQAYRLASEIAHGAGRKIALTLSDTFCVERHLAEWRDLVVDAVDVVFANEGEIQVLYGTDFDAAVEQLRAEVEIGFVTRGAKGSIIVTADEVVEVPAEHVARVVDTTGAGDQYAAGALYGLSRGLSLAECGRLGSIAAAEVISHLGARPHTRLSALA